MTQPPYPTSGDTPVGPPRGHEAPAWQPSQTNPSFPHQGQPYTGQPLAGPGWPGGTTPPASKKPWYRRKRVLIPAGVVAAFVAIGAMDPAPKNGTTSASPSTTAPDTSGSSSNAQAGSSTPAPAAEPAANTSNPGPSSSSASIPASVSYKGTGDKVLKIKKPASVAIATITNTGSSNFIVETLDDNFKSSDVLVNTIGGYKGTEPFRAST